MNKLIIVLIMSALLFSGCVEEQNKEGLFIVTEEGYKAFIPMDKNNNTLVIEKNDTMYQYGYVTENITNSSFLTLNPNFSNITQPTFVVKHKVGYDYIEMYSITSTSTNYNHSKITINKSFITNITYENNKMIIFVNRD